MKKTLISFIFFLSLVTAHSTAFSQIYHWAKGIGGAGADEARAVAVDASGNSYITGTFTGTVDFDPGAGTQNLTAAGNDLFIAKYDNWGNYVWAFKIGASGYERGFCLAIDPTGNIVITGRFNNTVDFDPGVGTANLTNSSGTHNCFIAKYSNTGNYIWVKGILGTSESEMYGMSIDASGDIYAGGWYGGTVDLDGGTGIDYHTSSGSLDMFFVKYDNSGNYMLGAVFGSSGLDQITGIKADAADNIFLTGYFSGTVDFDPGAGVQNLSTAGSYEIVICKYNAAGGYVWSKRLGGSSGDLGLAITLDASANIYTTGYFSSTVDFNPGAGVFNITSAGMYDVFISKLDSTGTFMWANGIGSAQDDMVNKIVLDATDNVYITGSFSATCDFDPGVSTASLTSFGSRDVYLAKYSSSGVYIAAKQMGGTGLDDAYGLATAPLDKIFVSGTFAGTADFDPAVAVQNRTAVGANDIFLAKYGDACINPNTPTLVATPADVCPGAVSTLSIISGNLNDATNWQWYSSCAGAALGTGTSLIVTPTVSTTYFIRGEGGCTNVTTCTSIGVIVNTCPTGLAENINQDHVIVPSIFSPNGDGDNDVLFVVGKDIKSFHFQVYNLLGQPVFKTTNLQEGWDGTCNGKDIGTGILIYQLEVAFTSGPPQVATGKVLLVR